MTATPAPAQSRLAVVLRRILFMGVGMLVALVIAEVALRVLQLAPAAGIATVNARDYERLPGMFAPNQHVRDVQKPALPFTVTIDSLGFRGAEFVRPKPAQQRRVVMLGDSYVYGDFVDDEHTLPFQLEQRLRAPCGDVLVINGGLGGTTIVDQAFMLERTLALAPDVVVLVYVIDDFANLANQKPSWELLAENRAKKSRFPLSIVYPVMRNTALWNLALKFRATRINQETATTLQQAFAADQGGTALHLRERYGTVLLAMRDTLKARGIPLVFAMYPSSQELPAGSENLTWMEQFAGKQGIAAVNFRTALRGAGVPDSQLYWVPIDGHPRPLGYSITADVLAPLVRGSLPATSCQR